MKNFKIINLNLLRKIVLILLFVFYSQILFGTENKIIFKINNKAFTTLDYKKRVQYLDFVGNNNNLSQDFILDDFVSANLFYEYYDKSNSNFNLNIIEVFENIKKANEENNKKYKYQINEESIRLNIEIDLVRKTILENILKSNISELNVSRDEIDLLYKFTIHYINFNTKNKSEIINDINNIKNINLIEIKKYLENKKIIFFEKTQEINDSKKIDKRIQYNILSDNNFFILEKNNEVSFVIIEKNFETFDGLIVDIFSVRSKENVNNQELKCEKLIKQKDSNYITNKEYNFTDLNNELKKNLKNVNDYLKFYNNDENIYIVLCNIKFDKKILNNINLNKLVNLNADKIEEEFIEKYSKIYNLNIIND